MNLVFLVLSYFSHCCWCILPVSLLSFLLYPPCVSCFHSVPQAYSEAILHPPTPNIKTFCFYYIQGCKMMSDHVYRSPQYPLFIFSSNPLLSKCFFGLYALSVWPLQPSPPCLSSRHIELYDSHQICVNNGDKLMYFICISNTPLSLFKH